MLWLVKAGSAEEAEALRLSSAMADDLADATALTPSLGAARLYRRRLLRAHAARALNTEPAAIGIEREMAGGQRIVAPKPLFASVATRENWTAIALSSRPVGVDIETRLVEHPLPTNLLHPRERAALANLSVADRGITFLRFWTAREAYLKATGRGLPTELASVEARDEIKGEGVVLVESDVACARAAITLTDSLVVAVVELGPPE